LSCTRGKKEATCSRTNLMDSGKIPVFTFQFFLCYSNFALVLPIPPSSHFTQKHQKRPWPLSFLLKLSPFSPLQNHHHLRRFSRFWSFCVRLWVKVTPFLYFIKFLCSYSPYFCLFFCFFVLSFYAPWLSFLLLIFI